MKVYHSAFSLSEESIPLLRNRKVKVLRSFYTDKSTDIPEFCSGLFLDSGAFSAYRSGASIDVNEYADFLEENRQHFDACASLDVIGSYNESLKNQKILDKRGLFAIPTYHVGEPKRILKGYVDNYPYVALGGMVPHSGTHFLKTWVDSCFNVIDKTDPKVKIHGFGMTDFQLLKCYPWYSIDSTTAARAGRTGVLVTPWGQRRVSTAIKTHSSMSVITELTKNKIMDWINLLIPNFITEWEQVAAPPIESEYKLGEDAEGNVDKEKSKEASQRRIIINAFYIEDVAQSAREPRPTYNTGFELGN